MQENYISNMISNFDIFDVVQNPGDIKAVRNYLLWNIGEKIYYLEYQGKMVVQKGQFRYRIIYL